MNLPALRRALTKLLNLKNSFLLQPCGGGDTHHSFYLFTKAELEATAESYFVKVNSLCKAPILQSEADSLRSMGGLLPGLYPTLIAECVTDELSILVMSFHQLKGISARSAAKLGKLLAKQHAIVNEECGWHSDNFIGGSAQRNDWMRSWPDFFLTQRLQPQLLMAVENGLAPSTARDLQRQIESPPLALTEHQPQFVLLHGDLWPGNAGYDSENSSPLLFDPAPYYGDSETDLAMTQLFGKFPDQFYASYHDIRPLQHGYEIRRELYNLYHTLNHFNLFGNSYHTAVEENLYRLK